MIIYYIIRRCYDFIKNIINGIKTEIVILLLMVVPSMMMAGGEIVSTEPVSETQSTLDMGIFNDLKYNGELPAL